MAGLNRMILTGRLVKDPSLRYTNEEIPVARFTVAVNDIKKKNGKVDVNYFDCVAWRGLAGICGEYLKKGALVAVEGKLQIKKYESKGVKKTSTEIIIDNMLMLDNKYFSAMKGSQDSDSADEENE